MGAMPTPDDLSSPPRPLAPPAGGSARVRAAGEGRSSQIKNPWPFLLFAVVLCVAGWFLVSWMSDSSRTQDCGMAGRRNCAPLDPAIGR